MKKQDLDNIHKLKDSEFTNLLHSRKNIKKR